ASACHPCQFSVAKLEQGLGEPTWVTVQTLAKAGGVTVLDVVVEHGEAGPRRLGVQQVRLDRRAPERYSAAPIGSQHTTPQSPAEPFSAGERSPWAQWGTTASIRSGRRATALLTGP